MIAWTIAQIALLGGLLALAAYGAESALRAATRPTRWAWVGALVMLVVLAALAPMRGMAERVTNAPLLLPAATTATNIIVAPTGLLATLGNSWQEFTAAATRTAQQGWSVWHATVPVGTDRVLLTAWLIASVALLVAFAAVHLRFQRRRAQWPVGTVHGTTVRIASDVGPAVIGVTKAEIVVPQWLLTRDAREQELVLAHEREHVRLHDPLLLAIAQATIVLLPWHPAVWWMASRLRLAVELDCDRRVLQRGASARDYGTLLIDLTDHRTGFGAALPAFSCTPSHLERRLIAMTPKPLRYPLVRALSTGALASLALLAACEAKLPTSDEVNNMSAASATAAVGRVALMDTTEMKFYVDGARVSKDSANRIPAERIMTVNAIRSDEAANEVRITTIVGANTVKPGDVSSPNISGDRARAMFRNTTRDSSGRVIENNGFVGLMVIDGVITPAANVNTLSPDRIESINVIKGPAATAKYTDPRAANGVIEITTKQAKP